VKVGSLCTKKYTSESTTLFNILKFAGVKVPGHKSRCSEFTTIVAGMAADACCAHACAVSIQRIPPACRMELSFHATLVEDASNGSHVSNIASY
jgi:hypothetical protein